MGWAARTNMSAPAVMLREMRVARIKRGVVEAQAPVLSQYHRRAGAIVSLGARVRRTLKLWAVQEAKREGVSLSLLVDRILEAARRIQP